MTRPADALRRAEDRALDYSVPLASVPLQTGVRDGSTPYSEGVQSSLSSVSLTITRVSQNPGLEISGTQFTGFNPKLTEKLVVMPDMAQGAVEQYRKLAATLHHSHIERGLKVVMVTSAMPGEGKTLTAANLALTLSESYRRQVLLIDADLRRPALYDVFQLPNIAGLSDWLKMSTERKLTPVRISDRLAFVPAGHPNPDPIGGLTSERMRCLLNDAATMFDWVIIDTPPVGLLTDANLLLNTVDGALLVIRAGVTPHELIRQAVQALGRDRLLGVVMNCTTEELEGRNGYYGYYGYAAPSSKG